VLKKKRILIGKVGLDGHDRGALIVAEFLKDSGFEVVYTGLHKTAHALIQIAVQEDISVVGISILSGSHKVILKEVISQAQTQGLTNFVLFVGGVIPSSDYEELTDFGIKAIFPQETPLRDISNWLNEEIFI
jgi:methylmalonyl-CoA mutase C-terminal domain/subunit